MAVTITRGHLLRFNDPPEAPEPPEETPVFDSALISEALTWTTPVFTWEADYNASSVIGAENAMFFLALVSYYYPDNVAAVTKTRDIIQASLSANREPVLFGMYGWGQPLFAAVLVLAKNTPTVWDQLTADQINRADWMMRLFAVVGNYAHNAAHSIRLDVALSRNGQYLPNQRNYVGPMSYNYLYWGGAAEVNAILAAFNFDTYLAQMASFGWTRNRNLWLANSQTRQIFNGALLSYTNPANGANATVTSQGVRRPFTFRGISVNPETGVRSVGPEYSYTPLNMIIGEELGYMYGLEIMDEAPHTMTDAQCPGVTGHINGAGSAYVGEMGMCYEFGTNPEGRSSFHYTSAGNHPVTAHWATLKALGVDLDLAWYHLWYANEHLYYEAAIQGWWTADGQGRCNQVRGEASVTSWRHGYIFNKEIYRAVMRPISP